MRYQDVVLTSADGQSIYATAIVFFEDLSLIEESINDYDEKFRVNEGKSVTGLIIDNTTESENNTASNNDGESILLPLNQIRQIMDNT